MDDAPQLDANELPPGWDDANILATLGADAQGGWSRRLFYPSGLSVAFAAGSPPLVSIQDSAGKAMTPIFINALVEFEAKPSAENPVGTVKSGALAAILRHMAGKKDEEGKVILPVMTELTARNQTIAHDKKIETFTRFEKKSAALVVTNRDAAVPTIRWEDLRDHVDEVGTVEGIKRQLGIDPHVISHVLIAMPDARGEERHVLLDFGTGKSGGAEFGYGDKDNRPIAELPAVLKGLAPAQPETTVTERQPERQLSARTAGDARGSSGMPSTHRSHGR